MPKKIKSKRKSKRKSKYNNISGGDDNIDTIIEHDLGEIINNVQVSENLRKRDAIQKLIRFLNKQKYE